MIWTCCTGWWPVNNNNNLLIFPRNLCSYIARLINYWSTLMLTICSFSCSEFKNPLRMTHLCSNDSISIVKSINLVNALDLTHCASWEVFPSIWKQRYYFPGVGRFWSGLLVVIFCWHCSEWDLKITWTLSSVSLWFFLGVSN